MQTDKEIREEFKKWAYKKDVRSFDEMSDWWLQKLSTYKSQVREVIEGMNVDELFAEQVKEKLLSHELLK